MGVRKDPATLVAGVAVTLLGVLLLLDATEAIRLRFDYAGPAMLAAVGAVLVALGLAKP